MSEIHTLIDRLSDRQRREFALWCVKRTAATAAALAAARAAALAAARDAERAAQRAELERMLGEQKS